MTRYLDELSAFLAECQFEHLSPPAIERARLVIADSIATIAAGSREPEVEALTERLCAGGDGGPATVIGPGRGAEAAKAAFVNGTAGTFLELDEGNQYCRGHPGIHAVPAALAFAEARALSGRELVTAVVLGYEVGARIGIASKLSMAMHPHGTWGTVGAAVAVAKLAGADAEAMARTINVSSSLGLATSRKTMLEGGLVRNTYAGVSGHMGVLTHDLVSAGFTGEKDGLATVWGSVASDRFEPQAMLDELGQRWEIARNYFKRHAACRYTHAALDVITGIARERAGGLNADEIAKIEVATYSLAGQLNDREPTNTLAGKFSVPFAVATTIVNGTSGVQSFTWEAVRNEAVRALARRVEVREDPKLTAMMPEFRPATVVVTFTDGSQVEAGTTTNKGDTEDPYSAGELSEKYYELATRAWDRATAEAIHDDIMAIDSLSDVNTLTARMLPMTEAAEAGDAMAS
jgi:2-methylcitrate dehydratase PrpD